LKKKNGEKKEGKKWRRKKSRIGKMKKIAF